MENENDFPKIGRDFQKWHELDRLLSIPESLPDLDIELFRRQNVWVASSVVISGLLKANPQQRKNFLMNLTPQHFNPQSLCQYLFERIVSFLEDNETIPISELEKWIPEYHLEVWNESPPHERMLFAHNFNLRRIINFNPTEEQVNRAIELRKMTMEKKSSRSEP